MIEAKARMVLEELLQQYPSVSCIGITGQMHGIVYLDGKGSLLSPLYTWQDQRSAAICAGLQEQTGYHLSAGYGLATHCALQEKGGVPEGAAKVSTIMDYLAFSLCGRENLRIHSTNAASLGFFDLEKGSFDRTALEKVGVNPEILPQVTGKSEIVGTFRGIPVAVPIGDNQASFLGSVPQPETMALANFGTGSQISLLTENCGGVETDGSVELRPFHEKMYLVCGSALCGGRAYALLEQFFRHYAEACGLPAGEQYTVMNRLAAEGLQSQDLPRVTTTFCGTRAEPDGRGSIESLGEENFTPSALIAGTLLGMARELHQMLAKMPGKKMTTLVASGNAIRRNPALQQALEMVFGMRVRIPAHQEEAAFGAALFAASAVLPQTRQDLALHCIHFLP